MNTFWFFQCFGRSKSKTTFLDEETDSIKPTKNPAHTLISCGGYNTVSPPGLRKWTDFSSPGMGDVTHCQVTKVQSIDYHFQDGVKSPFIGELEVEVIVYGKVVRRMQYGDVLAMDGGKNAVAEFQPITQMVV